MHTSDHLRRMEAEAPRALRCAALTVSDTRTPDRDESGRMIRDRLEDSGHTIAQYLIVPDEPEQIVALVRALVQDRCAVIIISGGTGLARRDSTFEAIDVLLDKRLPGFGELFRAMSYTEIGPAAMLSRAAAGIIGSTVVFVVPGSPHAVDLALDRLILPELRHIVWEAVRQ